ncbi:MAG: hypothetical protein PHC61_11865 [Chitinivibrionales bacterium]|nr:hypothetical protein [Chitinivibrionales bacterium]
MLDAAVFANTQENYTVDGQLDREIKFTLAQIWIIYCNIPGKQIAPALDFFQKLIIDFGGAFFAFSRIRVFIK